MMKSRWFLVAGSLIAGLTRCHGRIDTPSGNSACLPSTQPITNGPAFDLPDLVGKIHLPPRTIEQPLVMAVVRWRAPSGRPCVEVMAPEEVLRLYPPLPHDAGSVPALGVAPALVLRRGVERSPAVRNADPNAVYNEAVHLNACYSVMKEFVRRRVRAHRLYARVARVVGRAGADAA